MATGLSRQFQVIFNSFLLSEDEEPLLKFACTFSKIELVAENLTGEVKLTVGLGGQKEGALGVGEFIDCRERVGGTPPPGGRWRGWEK